MVTRGSWVRVQQASQVSRQLSPALPRLVPAGSFPFGRPASSSGEELKKGSSSRSTEAAMGSETFLEILLAILLPPLGVFLRYGIGVEFWICLVLTILGYIPGIIYAIYVLVA
nr:unnamed protein product [Digitaria exilis]